MNSLHTSAQQRSPIRGVALRPLGSGRAEDSTGAKAASPSLEALDAMQQDVSLLQRTLRTVLKATRTAARSSAVQTMAFIMVLLASANIATAASVFWVGAGSDWSTVSNWSSVAGSNSVTNPPTGSGPGGVPGAGDVVFFNGVTITITAGLPAGVDRILVQGGANITLAQAGATLNVNAASAVNSETIIININSQLTLNSTNLVLVSATSQARVFGTMSVLAPSVVTFQGAGAGVLAGLNVESGGTLRIASGGSVSNTGTKFFSDQGGRGTLRYEDAAATVFTLPANGTNEMPNPMLGNVYIRRTGFPSTTSTPAAALALEGTLTLDQCSLNMTAFNLSVGSINCINSGSLVPLSASGLTFNSSNASNPPPTSNLIFATNSLIGSIDVKNFGNVVLNSDIRTGQFNISNTAVGAFGQFTVSFGRTMLLVNQNSGNVITNTAGATNQLVVNGTFSMDAGNLPATANIVLANNNPTGIVVNAGGALVMNSFRTGAMEFTAHITTNSPSYAATSSLTYGGSSAANDPLTTTGELPAIMPAPVTINRRSSLATTPPANNMPYIQLAQHTTFNGALTLSAGNLDMNNFSMQINGALTSNGGAIQPPNADGASGIGYNNAANSFLPVTGATAVPTPVLSALEIQGSGGLTVLGGSFSNLTITINGATAPGLGLQAGRLLVNGPYVMNGTSLTFAGSAATGGFIDPASVSTIAGNLGSNMSFLADKPSTLRMAVAPNNVLNTLTLQATAAANGTPLVSSVAPMSVNTLTLGQTGVQNGILRLANATATLTVVNNINAPAVGSANAVANNNYVDVSGGSPLSFTVLNNTSRFMPIGSNVEYSPLLIENNLAALPGGISDTYSAQITRPAPVTSPLNDRVNQQWLVSKANGTNIGNFLTLYWITAGGAEIGNFTTARGANPANVYIAQVTGTTTFNKLAGTLLGAGTIASPFNIRQNLAVGTPPSSGLNSTPTPFMVSTQTFPLFWVGGSQAAATWNNSANWSTSSGGAPGATPPTASDSVVFDQPNVVTITSTIPAAIRRLSIRGGANVTFAQNGATLQLAETAPASSLSANLVVAAGSTFQVTNGFSMNFAAGTPVPNATVFGTLVLGQQAGLVGTLTMQNMAGALAIQAGGTLQMSGGTLVSGMGVSYTPTSTLLYQDNLTTAVGPGAEFPSTGQTLGTLVINRTGTNNAFNLPAIANLSSIGNGGNMTVLAGVVANPAGITINGNLSVQGGVLNNIGATTVSGNTSVTTGGQLVMPTGFTFTQTGTINATGPGRLVGNANMATNLTINGAGTSSLLFDASTAPLAAAATDLMLGGLTINNAGAQVVINSTTLTVTTGGVGLVMTNSSLSRGLYVPSTAVLNINQNSSLTAGKMLVDGVVSMRNGTLAINAANLLDIGTTGTLNIVGNTTGISTNPVNYLASTSLLQYLGTGNIATTAFDFPTIMNGSVTVNKADNATFVRANASKRVLGTTTLITGKLDIGFNGTTLTMNGPLVSNSSMATISAAGAAGSATAIEYNNPAPANIRLDGPNALTFLNYLAVTNSTVTFSSGTNATIDGAGGASPLAGQLLLNNANLVLNRTTLNFTGAAATGGFIPNTTGTITGDAAANISFGAPRQSFLRMAGGTGNNLNIMTLGAIPLPIPGASPNSSNPLVVMTAPATVLNNIAFTAANDCTLQLSTGANLTLGPTGYVSGTSATKFIDLSGNAGLGGANLTMTVTNGTVAHTVLPIGMSTGYSPLSITNNSGATDTYTVGLQPNVTNLPTTYLNRVNAQWTVAKNTSPSGAGTTLRFQWNQLAQEAAGFVANRALGSVNQWTGAYTNLGGLGLITAGMAPTFAVANALTPANLVGTPFIITNPPNASLIVPTLTNSINGFDGLNGGILGPIVSGASIPIRLSIFNGLGQQSPVSLGTDIVAIVGVPSGQSATFATVGLGAVGTPIQNNIFTVPTVPSLNVGDVSTTTTNFQIRWLNPGAASTSIPLGTTQATITFQAVSGMTTLTSATYTITIQAAPISPVTLAYTQVQNSSNGTLGFNGGGLGQFNITGGIGIPINFGLFSNSNFLAATTNITTVTASIAPHPSNPTAVFSTTPGGSNGAINPVTIASGANGGFILPIFNWTSGAGFPGIVKALITLSTPGLGSTTVTVVIATTGTASPLVASKLGYSVNSGDILNPATATQGFNGGNITTGSPVISGLPVRVNFASFTDNGAVIRPNATTQVQMSVATDLGNPSASFLLGGTTATTITSDGTGSVFPTITWTNPPNGANFATALVTLSVSSGQSLISTTAQVVVFTTGSLGVVTSFNPSSSTGTLGINGGNLNIPSGRPFNVDFGFFNSYNVLALGAANPMQLSIVSVSGGQTVTFDGTTSIPILTPATQGRISNAVLNWRNPSIAGPISVVIRLSPLNPPPAFALLGITEATITLSTGSSVPVALAFSQVSSTGTQGINGGVLTIASTALFNIDLGLFDANGVLSSSLSNSSVALSVQPLTGGQAFTVSGNTGGVFVNQSGIRLNGVAVTWTNPSAPTTQVRLVVSTTAGAGPIASTSAVVTISAASLFPIVTSFTPGLGGPGTTVIINGANFTGANGVLFNGVAATTFTVLGDNAISAVVPPGATTGPITVSRGAVGTFPPGSGTSAAIFTVGIPPTITSFTPLVGGTGTVLQINGTNFGSLSNISFITVAGVSATVQSINDAGTQMQVLITGSASTARTAAVTIATATGVATSAQLFTYNLPPIIASVTPGSAIVNGQDIPIIIRGSNFDINLFPPPQAVQSGVYFSSTNAPQGISPSFRISIQSVTPTEIRATISGTFNNMVGQRFVLVLNNDGQLANFPFQLLPGGSPTLTSISPSTTSASGVAFIATITGTNFFGTAGTRVTANGSQQLTLINASSTQLQVLIPSSLNTTPGTINITVINSDNQQVQGTIVVTDPGRPVINSVFPPRAIVGSPALTVTLTGSGFFLNAEVSFNNVPLQVVPNELRSATRIVVQIPANLLASFGTFPITVRNPGGFSGGSVFSVGYPAPTITSVVTASGANPGQTSTAASVFPFQLAITGTGFRQGLTVALSGANLAVISTSDTQVIVQVPASANNIPGTFPLTLTNVDGLSTLATFTFGPRNAPIITSVSPGTTNATATPFIITINGSNFAVSPQGQPLSGFQVRYNGQILEIRGATPNQILAFVPAGVNNQEPLATVQVINPDTQFDQRTISVLCAVCPLISSVTPGALRSQYPFDVTFTITGSNFQQGATVTVGGVPLRIQRIEANQIIAIAPAGFFLGDPTIRVVNPDGRSFTLQNGFTVGVREVLTVETMIGGVYPNPIEEMITFEATLPKAAQLRVRITDVLGNTVVLFTQAVGAGRFSQQLDVSALRTGVYFFEMTDGERRFTDKLIKR